MPPVLAAGVSSSRLLVLQPRPSSTCKRSTGGGFGSCNRRGRVAAFRVSCRGSLPNRGRGSERKGYEGGEGWVLDNAGAVRSAPLFVGVAGLVVVLLNRFFSGIPAVADASSAQSRADVLVVALSATVVLTGLVWKSIAPKPQFPVALDGVQCMRLVSGLPEEATRELKWAWEALAGATNAAALVVIYRRTSVLQAGMAAVSSEQGTAASVDVLRLLQGSLYKTVCTSGKQIYLANLSLFPDRFQLPFLPSNSQAVIIQPLGNEGVMIVGSDTLRGFGTRDQEWIVAIGEKLDSTLADVISSEMGEVPPSSDASKTVAEQFRAE